MTHVFTRIAPADDIWIKGILSVLTVGGGGRVIRRTRGGRRMIDVEARRPDVFLRLFNDVMNWRPPSRAGQPLGIQ